MKKYLITLVMITMLVGNTFAKEINLDCTDRTIFLDTTNMSATLSMGNYKSTFELFSDADTYWFTEIMDAGSGWFNRYQVDRNDLSWTEVTYFGYAEKGKYNGQCSIVETTTKI